MVAVNSERSASICTSVLSAGILIPYQGAKPAVLEAAQLDRLPGPCLSARNVTVLLTVAKAL